MAATNKALLGPWKHKGRKAAYNLEWRKANLPAALVAIARCRARKTSLEFTITKDDVVIPETCPILKVPLVYGTKYAASIDRVDNSKGYVPGNIQVISRLANELKRDATFEEMSLLGEWTKTLISCQTLSTECLKAVN